LSIFGPLSPTDPVQPLLEDPSTKSPAETHSKRLVWLFIGSSLLLVSVLVVGLSAWIHYSRKFGNIDHNADHIFANSLPFTNAVPNSHNEIEINFVTVYTNSPGGVTLKLPGMWDSINPPQPMEPDLAHRYCLLSAHDGSIAVFWPIFPDPRLSLDSDASRMVTRFSGSNYFTLEGQRDLMINGKPAKELRFAYQGNNEYRMILVRKWPALYLLAVTGSADSKDTWKRIEDALPDSLEIQ
jgi:hypothetical protein